MTFSVNPPDLQESSRIAGGSAQEIQALPADLVRLLREVGEAAGSPDVAAAGAAAARRWGRASEATVREARSLAQGVGGVGDSYARAEGAMTRRFGAPW